MWRTKGSSSAPAPLWTVAAIVLLGMVGVSQAAGLPSVRKLGQISKHGIARCDRTTLDKHLESQRLLNERQQVCQWVSAGKSKKSKSRSKKHAVQCITKIACFAPYFDASDTPMPHYMRIWKCTGSGWRLQKPSGQRFLSRWDAAPN